MVRRRRASDLVVRKKQSKALLGDYIPEDIHKYRVCKHTFTIYIGGDPDSLDESTDEPGVEYRMADRLELNIGLLSSIDSERPILVKLSSCGGSWPDGMQMFSAILTCPNPITVLGTKWCESMTSIIPLAADRFILRPPAQYMFHRGSHEFGGTDLEADTDDVERRRVLETMMRIYIARLHEQGRYSGHAERRIREILDKGLEKKSDVWLTADEAVEWGFADGIFTGDHATLRAARKNLARRERMMAVLRKPVHVEIKIS